MGKDKVLTRNDITRKDIPAFFLYHKILLDEKGNISKSTQLFINKLCRLIDEIVYAPDRKRLIYLNYEVFEYDKSVIYVKGMDFYLDKLPNKYIVIFFAKNNTSINTYSENEFKEKFRIFKFNRKLCYMKKEWIEDKQKIINSFNDRSDFVKCFLGEKIAKNIPFSRYEQIVIGNI